MILFWLSFSVAIVSSGVCGYYIPRDVGPIHLTGIYGVLTPKYHPMAKVDIEASAMMKYHFEVFRQFFKTGHQNIPALDPYHYTNPVPLIFNEDNLHTAVNLSELYISGAEEFVLNSLELRIETGRLDIVLEFPTLTIDVDFIMDMKVDELKQNVTGHANITLENVKLATTLQAEGYPLGEDLDSQKLTIGAFEFILNSPNTQYNLRNADPKETITWRMSHRTRRSVQETLSRQIALLIVDKVSYITAFKIVHEIDNVLKHYNRSKILEKLVMGYKQRSPFDP